MASFDGIGYATASFNATVRIVLYVSTVMSSTACYVIERVGFAWGAVVRWARDTFFPRSLFTPPPMPPPSFAAPWAPRSRVAPTRAPWHVSMRAYACR